TASTVSASRRQGPATWHTEGNWRLGWISFHPPVGSPENHFPLIPTQPLGGLIHKWISTSPGINPQPRRHPRTDHPDCLVPHFPPFSHKDRGLRGRFNLPATRFTEKSMRAGERTRWRTLVAGWCVLLAAGCMAHRPLPADAPQVRAACPVAT